MAMLNNLGKETPEGYNNYTEQVEAEKSAARGMADNPQTETPNGYEDAKPVDVNNDAPRSYFDEGAGRPPQPPRPVPSGVVGNGPAPSVDTNPEVRTGTMERTTVGGKPVARQTLYFGRAGQEAQSRATVQSWRDAQQQAQTAQKDDGGGSGAELFKGMQSAWNNQQRQNQYKNDQLVVGGALELFNGMKESGAKAMSAAPTILNAINDSLKTANASFRIRRMDTEMRNGQPLFTIWGIDNRGRNYVINRTAKEMYDVDLKSMRQGQDSEGLMTTDKNGVTTRNLLGDEQAVIERWGDLRGAKANWDLTHQEENAKAGLLGAQTRQTEAVTANTPTKAETQDEKKYGIDMKAATDALDAAVSALKSADVDKIGAEGLSKLQATMNEALGNFNKVRSDYAEQLRVGRMTPNERANDEEQKKSVAGFTNRVKMFKKGDDPYIEGPDGMKLKIVLGGDGKKDFVSVSDDEWNNRGGTTKRKGGVMKGVQTSAPSETKTVPKPETADQRAERELNEGAKRMRDEFSKYGGRYETDENGDEKFSLGDVEFLTPKERGMVSGRGKGEISKELVGMQNIIKTRRDEFEKNRRAAEEDERKKARERHPTSANRRNEFVRSALRKWDEENDPRLAERRRRSVSAVTAVMP